MATTRAGDPASIETKFQLDPEHRQGLKHGRVRPLLLEQVPEGCEPGATFVIAWTRPSRSLAGDIVIDIPREATYWLTVTRIVRHKTGGYLIWYDTMDRRETIRFLRRTPPILDPHRDTGPTESSYTTSRFAACDDLEVVTDRWQQQRTKEAAKRDELLRSERVAANRTERWRRKRQSRRVARALTQPAT